MSECMCGFICVTTFNVSGSVWKVKLFSAAQCFLSDTETQTAASISALAVQWLPSRALNSLSSTCLLRLYSFSPCLLFLRGGKEECHSQVIRDGLFSTALTSAWHTTIFWKVQHNIKDNETCSAFVIWISSGSVMEICLLSVMLSCLLHSSWSQF